MRVDLVKAGEFLISAKYIREGNKRVLKVHEKCIHREHCIQNLGLSANSTDAYVVSRVVKQLFDSTLDQVLATDDQPEKITEEYKNDKRRVVDEKLQVHRSAQGQIDLIQVFDRVFGNLKKLRLRWPKRFAVSHQLPIIVQLHRTATCSHLLQHRLTDKSKTLYLYCHSLTSHH